MTPSWAVTYAVMVVAPGFSVIRDDAVPDAIDTPLMVTAAVLSAKVGVTVIAVTVDATFAV